MDQLNATLARINATVQLLAKTLDEKGAIEALRASLQADWAQYRQIVAQIRPTLTLKANRDILDDSVAEASKIFNQADATIINRLERLQEIATQEARAAAELANQPAASTATKAAATVSTQTKLEQPAVEKPAVGEATMAEVRVLTSLIKQITDQYNQILAGNYPRPTPKEEIVGATAAGDTSNTMAATETIESTTDEATETIQKATSSPSSSSRSATSMCSDRPQCDSKHIHSAATTTSNSTSSNPSTGTTATSTNSTCARATDRTATSYSKTASRWSKWSTTTNH